MWQKRGPALLCLLLATALTVFAAARSPAAPPGEVPPPQTLEEESLLYEETPVQIISLLDLEPVDTRASANPVRVGGGTLDPVGQAEMASVLAECTLKDNTIVRLYVTAEGLIDGAFLRPGARVDPICPPVPRRGPGPQLRGNRRPYRLLRYSGARWLSAADRRALLRRLLL